MATGTGLTLANVVDAAENILKDSSNAIWLAADLQTMVAEVAREISKRGPKKMKTALPIREFTRVVDVSSLTSLIEIRKIEYLPDCDPPQFRNFFWQDPDLSLIKLDISGEPTITDGHLTGTLTFTLASNNVTGSGSAFESELAEGYFIKLSDGTHWYRVVHIASDTSLYLEHAFAETTHTDDAGGTDYLDRESIVYVHWRKGYSVSTTSDMPAKYDEILVIGTVALALHAEQTYQVNRVPVGDNVPITYRGVADRFMQRYLNMLDTIQEDMDDEDSGIVSVGWCAK